MAKIYKITSQAASEHHQTEIGETLELELSDDQERAQVAAGWLEPVKKKKED